MSATTRVRPPPVDGTGETLERLGASGSRGQQAASYRFLLDANIRIQVTLLRHAV